ncbi:hypothetical protein NEMBOFW57_005048 [Staphylotrichum longicolle]|uniref:SET domain-containing protein n=1 Tax=Staphylotrichum longicolle TaxID=669026 RepID=A0AAD4HY48_9PEZI|nr:hypothetical protein NEMBOFW57_005048 [Staphylotrichum longicolle]
MPWPTLPIENLPAWAYLNDVSFHNAQVTNIKGKGYGVVCSKDLEATDGTADVPALLTVPHDLVLNAAAVDEYAKEDKSFRQLLDTVGHHVTKRNPSPCTTPPSYRTIGPELTTLQSARADVLLFLLVQTVLASRSGHSPVGVKNPWTEYLQFLPETVLVPTLWTEDERHLLRGTSLEAAVNAKISALDAEFALIREKSSDITCWFALLWEHGSVSFTDWIRLDALYRSRCLELPRSGESMVPCIDMLNHSAAPSAYYEESPKDEVVLLPRPGVRVAQGDEITISYGEAKSAAEMLFSYGFIDRASTADGLVLPLSPFPDDPLAKAKLVAFGEAPKIHVARDDGRDGPIRWRSAFAYLMCVNEEDGLEFRVLQQTDGGRQLRVFWQDEDVTDRTSAFETLLRDHPLSALFGLRVATVVQECLQTQLERMQSTAPPDAASGELREDCYRAALLLREIEMDILERAIEALEEERSSLLTDKNVVAYLGLKEPAESGLAGEEASNEPDDFS